MASASSASARLAANAELVKQGQKLATKSFFKKPDWDGAGALFEKAALAYASMKEHERAVETYLLAVNAREQAGLAFTAAKNLEAAAASALALAGTKGEHPDRTLQAADLFRGAAAFYRESGNGDKAAETLSKAGRTLEPQDAKLARQLFEQAIDTYIDDEKAHMSSDTFKYLASLLLRENQLDDAIALYERQLKLFAGAADDKKSHRVSALYLTLIVLELARANPRAADMRFSEYAGEMPSFAASDNGRAASELLDAYEKGPQEALNKAAKDQVFNFLDNQVNKLVKGLKWGVGVGGGGGGDGGGGATPMTAAAAAEREALFALDNDLT